MTLTWMGSLTSESSCLWCTSCQEGHQRRISSKSSNLDGVIDFREFMLVVYIMSRGTPEENLKQIFKLLDINSDGTVSIGEFKRVIRDMFLLTNEKEVDSSIQELLAEKAFIEMDSNEEGKVTLEEFIKACLSQKKFSTMLTLKIIDVFVE